MWFAVLSCACSPPEPAASAAEPPRPSSAEEPPPRPSSAEEPEAAAEPAPPAEQSCETLLTNARRAALAVVDAHAACDFGVDCVEAAVSTPCFEDCAVALHPRGLAALREALADAETRSCPALAGQGCEAPRVRCARATPRCQDGRCLMDEGDPALADVPVPPENTATRADEPPARPPAGDVEQERARRLFEAVVHDDPNRAQDFFFPKEAFRHVKAIADPDGYWDRLMRRYRDDIHALHESIADLDRAEFERLEVVRRGGWVRPREEGNALPYWAARHNRLHCRVGDEARTLEVRVLITWGSRWYVTHLSELH